ncbi:MAG: sigma-E processing peptidase SpoIIGA [Ruminococcus sp.]|uniref:sigma-E processing peptidase SpoIIGA n=1 Tax=Ruminococcus sp. TaxID=41978 RepID=UPI0025F66BDE|nr:sigma-E processing peptidase SpoIIGA [Ruminococcus sp.]MBR5683375.1 sigma-E processing peptidase SpoIIGA [Ruminococcus sp.]
MKTIYVDVLIVLNIYVNFFLLRIAAGLTHSPLRTGRCAAASVYGSLFSLTILLPELGNLLSLLIKLAAAVSIVALAFGFHGKKRLMLNTTAFFAANFVLAGTVYGVYTMLKPGFIHFNNACFYIDFSLLILVVTTAALYFAVRAVRIFTDRTPDGDYRVFIRAGDKVLSLAGLADTGNALVDYFTGAPVIICSEESFSELTGAELDISLLPKGFRLLPCTAVSGSGLIPVFRPDEVLISSCTSGRKPVDAVIGFGRCGGKAVFNPKLLKI